MLVTILPLLGQKSAALFGFAIGWKSTILRKIFFALLILAVVRGRNFSAIVIFSYGVQNNPNVKDHQGPQPLIGPEKIQEMERILEMEDIEARAYTWE